MYRFSTNIWIIVVMLLAGCGIYQRINPNSPENKEKILESSSAELDNKIVVTPFATSLPDRVTLNGILFVLDPISKTPNNDDAIFLVPLQGDLNNITSIPTFFENEVPRAFVDEVTGEFVFTDIHPGLYAIVVLTVNNIQVPARWFESGDLAIIEVEEADRGNTIELGDLSL